MIEYSIIVPCYNEADNIKPLIESFSTFINSDNAELIIVDNGSNDSTALLKDELMSKYPFIKWVTIEKNIGYGFGIYTGLANANGNFLAYTHADLQTDPADVKKAIEMIKSFSTAEKAFVKGYRKGRGFIDRFFSRGMELFVSLILKQRLKDINAQPNVFTKDVFQNLKNPPNEWGFDLYLYYTAAKMGASISRFDVEFPARRHGTSKWNTGFFSRFSLSYKMLKYCFKLKQQ